MNEGIQDFKTWYLNQPLVTRTYLAAALTVTIIISLHLVSPYSLTYTFREGFMHLQLWRPFTALVFMGKFDFGTIFTMYFAYLALSKL